MGEPIEQIHNVVKYYDKSAEQYDSGYETPYFKELYNKITWYYIEPFLPDDGVVLDAGGGTAKWTLPIAERGLSVVLYDISAGMLKVAKKKVIERGLDGLVTFKEGDIRDINFPDNTFDFVLAEGDPISYCGDPNKAVMELARVLKPRNFMAAGVDSLYSMSRNSLVRSGPEEARRVLLEKRVLSPDWGFYCWAFSPDELRRMFETNGLEVVKILGKPVVYVSRPETEALLQDESKAKKILDLELLLCEEPSLIGYGGHLHIVGRKRYLESEESVKVAIPSQHGL